MCSRTDNASFLDIKDPAERATLVKEYVTAMKTVIQRNLANRALKLAIGDELHTLFHPIVNATKQAAGEIYKFWDSRYRMKKEKEESSHRPATRIFVRMYRHNCVYLF